MRTIVAGVFVTVAALVAGPALAADLPVCGPDGYAPASTCGVGAGAGYGGAYGHGHTHAHGSLGLGCGPAVVPPCPPPPPVDNGMGGAFYLRASVGGNMNWSGDHYYVPNGATTFVTTQPTTAGYGYSFGAGFGYEAGNGLRADVTIDQMNTSGLSDGADKLNLRSTLAMANAYLDFPLSMGGGAGLGGYVGAGLGGAFYNYQVTDMGGNAVVGAPDGWGYTPAAAAMAGVTYDMGSLVADLGYRAVFMPQVSNGQAAIQSNPAYTPSYVNNLVTQEVRATLRYRLN
jgi:hypothetical protein